MFEISLKLSIADYDRLGKNPQVVRQLLRLSQSDRSRARRPNGRTRLSPHRRPMARRQRNRRGSPRPTHSPRHQRPPKRRTSRAGGRRSRSRLRSRPRRSRRHRPRLLPHRTKRRWHCAATCPRGRRPRGVRRQRANRMRWRRAGRRPRQRMLPPLRSSPTATPRQTMTT